MALTPIQPSSFNRFLQNDSDSTSEIEFAAFIVVLLAMLALKLISDFFSPSRPQKSTNLKKRRGIKPHKGSSKTSIISSKMKYTKLISKKESSSHRYSKSFNDLFDDLLPDNYEGLENAFRKYVNMRLKPNAHDLNELAKLKGNGLYLQHLNSNLKDNEVVVRYAIMQPNSRETIKFASTRLLDKESLAIKVLKIQGSLIKYFSDRVINMPIVMRTAISSDFKSLDLILKESDVRKKISMLDNFKSTFEALKGRIKTDHAYKSEEVELYLKLNSIFLDFFQTQLKNQQKTDSLRTAEIKNPDSSNNEPGD